MKKTKDDKKITINKIDISYDFLGENVFLCLSSIYSLIDKQNRDFFNNFGDILSEKIISEDEKDHYFFDNQNENNKIYVLSGLRGNGIDIFETRDENNVQRIFIISGGFNIKLKEFLEYICGNFLSKLQRQQRRGNLEYAGDIYKKENDQLIIYDPVKIRSYIMTNDINLTMTEKLISKVDKYKSLVQLDLNENQYSVFKIFVSDDNSLVVGYLIEPSKINKK